jgi:soluble lytic murein transglycosylase-like protein
MFPALLLAAILGRNEVLVCAVVAEAERVGLDPVVVCSLVEVESGFNPRAKGKGGDYGLFQIHPRWHGAGYRRVGDNVAKGCEILRGELDRCHGEIDKALGRYNAGSNIRLGAVYAAKVLKVASRLRSRMGGYVWSSQEFAWRSLRAGFCSHLVSWRSNWFGPTKRRRLTKRGACFEVSQVRA